MRVIYQQAALNLEAVSTMAKRKSQRDLDMKKSDRSRIASDGPSDSEVAAEPVRRQPWLLRLCAADTADGQRCRAVALTGSPWCRWHDPETRERAAEKRRAILPGWLDRVDLSTRAIITETLERAIDELRAKRLDPEAARAIASLCDSARRNLEAAPRGSRRGDIEAIGEAEEPASERGFSLGL